MTDTQGNKETIKLKVIEVEANKLVAGAKYIFTISPQWKNMWEYIGQELIRLVGADNFTILWVEPETMKIYSIEDAAAPPTEDN